MFGTDTLLANRILQINPHSRWEQIESRTQPLITKIAFRLKLGSIWLNRIEKFQSPTLEQDITKCLLAIPEVHFRKQFYPIGKHKWVSSEGIVFKIQGNTLVIGRSSSSLSTANNENQFIDAIQSYRTKLRRITTYNTIFPFSVIDFFEKVPEIGLSASRENYQLNFKLSFEEFDKLRKKTKKIIKHLIWPYVELRTKFFEFSGSYIPTITSGGRLQQLYPLIIRNLGRKKQEKIKVLDIGCAPKIAYGSPTLVQFAQALKSSGYLCECLGIDILFPVGFVTPGDELHCHPNHQIFYKEHNICRSPPGLGKYDVVFCCNVINWYDAQPETKRKILDHAQKTVAENGLLIIDNSNYFFVLQRNHDKFTILLRKHRIDLETLN